MQHSTRGIIQFLGLAVIVITGFGCNKPNNKTVPLSEPASEIRDYYPAIGETIVEIWSADKKWRAYAINEESGSVTYLEGPNTKRKLLAALPAGFSPNNRYFIYTGSEGNLFNAMYVVNLNSPEKSTRMTNLGMQESGGPMPPGYIPPPQPKTLEWEDSNIFTYPMNEEIYKVD